MDRHRVARRHHRRRRRARRTSGTGRASGPHGITERNKVARAGYKVLENKYYLDWLYTDVIVGFIKGPIARATNWFNQNVIDGLVNLVGKTARTVGRVRLPAASTRAWSTPS